ncbi:DUF1593 domain-containing protein [Aureliella helgolandensis]|uniref:Cellulose-binding Sde182 nucleoside hydrolase-like domain-containing protein n=1 Tax=Aureliella helgolandensis TaxID=2527968 RepID=A0A518G8E4_9BACT|nr:DUF1593 domain-containing protein [Aureliella helgolandensis]QDV24856.1 hypothetical protein Q31a_31780 [Aureliella helgolandensis]
MKLCLLPVLISLLLLVGQGTCEERPRLAILTDIGGDPDDQQSLVRLLLFSNEFEIEAFVASASGTPGELKEKITRPDLILETIAAYEQVLPALQQHARRWPNGEALRAVVKSGNRRRGREHIGEGHDTDGALHLVQCIDSGSEVRPLNICIWGGQTDFAQAMSHVQRTRSQEEYGEFVRKFRVYDIADQDKIADWMRQQFPGMTYILSSAPKGRDSREATFRGMYLTGDETLTSLQWVEGNIRNTGPLGALYPTKTHTNPNPNGCLKEGDTPSWFFFLPQGGNDPRDPSVAGWGGQFERQSDGWYRDLARTADFDPRVSVSRWREEFQAEFAERASWCRSK